MLEHILATLTPDTKDLFTLFFVYFNIIIFTILFPNEIIMFIVGFLVALGKLNILALPIVILANSGIAFLYYCFSLTIKKRYFMHSKKLQKAQLFFQKYGKSSIFFSRLLPTLRVYISFVAGVAHMDKEHFILYTLYGYALLNTIWFGVGYLSQLVVKDIHQIDFQNFTLYSLLIFFIFLIPYLGMKFISKRFFH